MHVLGVFEDLVSFLLHAVAVLIGVAAGVLDVLFDRRLTEGFTAPQLGRVKVRKRP